MQLMITSCSLIINVFAHSKQKKWDEYGIKLEWLINPKQVRRDAILTQSCNESFLAEDGWHQKWETEQKAEIIGYIYLPLRVESKQGATLKQMETCISLLFILLLLFSLHFRLCITLSNLQMEVLCAVIKVKQGTHTLR